MDIDKEYFNLEHTLKTTPELVNIIKNNPDFAHKMYAAMCSVTWYRKMNSTEDEIIRRLMEDRTYWSCSWRYAGGIISDITGVGDYLDYYCGGDEGYVDEEVADILRKYNWFPVEEKHMIIG